MSDGKTLWLYDRLQKKRVAEQIFERQQMEFFYGHPVGNLIEKLALSHPWCSKLYGYLRSDPHKAHAQINNFLNTYTIDTSEIRKEIHEFKSFQEFFTRELKPEARPMPTDPSLLISPADARLLVFDLRQDRLIPIKGQSYRLLELLGNRSLAQQFSHGLACVFRLAPVDYHRFGYIDDGHHGPHVRLGHRLHSVHPWSLRSGRSVFTENIREYTVLHTRHFGAVIHMDVGALLVGRMVQHFYQGGSFARGQEKGYFELGGSTTILLFEANRVIIDSDIREASQQGIESLVKYRSAIGRRL